MQTIDSLGALGAILAFAWIRPCGPRPARGADYHAGQMALYQRISGHAYALGNEETPFDVEAAGQHLVTIGHLLCCMDLPPGSQFWSSAGLG